MSLLLAVLGRGIQKNPSGEWVNTELFEICAPNGAHLVNQQPANDDDPNSFIGGGELNLLASIALAKELNPAMVVFAYGGKSKYLHEIAAPSESELMTKMFCERMGVESNSTPIVEIFDETKQSVTRTGSDQEIQNIFTLAKRIGANEVGIITVAVHEPRSSLMAQGHLQKPEFSGLELQMYPSEIVLEKSDSKRYPDLFAMSVGSKSFARTFRREIGLGDAIFPTGGFNAYFRGVKQTAYNVHAQ